MTAHSFTGSDDRNLSGEPKSDSALFWRAYHMAIRTGCVIEYLNHYRQLQHFAELVAEADKLELERMVVSA